MEPMGSASSCETCDVYHPGRSLGDYGASRVRDIHLVIKMLIQRFHPSAQDYVYLNDKVMHFFGFMLVRTGRIQDPCDFLTHTKGNLSMLSHVGGRTGK